MIDREVLRVVRTLEDTYRSPDWAIVYSAHEEGLGASVLLTNRVEGVLQPMVLIELDELFDMERRGEDWLAEVAEVLRRELETAES